MSITSLVDKKRVFVAMSGGVDSSVSAALLKQQGRDVVGIHIKMWSDPDIPCSFKEDRYDAMRVAAKLDIPFQTWDFTKEYKTAVVEYMIREYAEGRTPNPDVMCNRHIKFGVFFDRAMETGADYVATGHYARVARREQETVNSEQNYTELLTAHCSLLTGADSAKDQSYFLWTLTQRELAKTLFPIGEFKKTEVRELAKKFGLSTAEKPDSQGICFIGEIDIREFLKKYIPTEPGRVLTTAGKDIGEHEGLSFYTIGQRQGIGIGGGIPYYVARKDFESNALVVSEGPYDGELFQNELTALDVQWTSGCVPKFPLQCFARIRYRQPVQACTVQADQSDKDDKIDRRNEQSDSSFSSSRAIHRLDQAVRSTNLIVTFDSPQRAVTPGQSIVFYSGDPLDPARGRELIGGGVIQ